MTERKMEHGELDFSLSYDKGITYLGVDNHDLVKIGPAGEDGLAEITVWATSHPESEILFQGKVQVREREDEEL